jgi:hypothetical protein
MLFGIKTATGFSSNADELKMGYEIFYSMVINPIQGELIKIFQGILEFNGVQGEELYFSPLIPFGILGDLMSNVGAQDAKNIIENPNADLPDTQETTPADGTVGEGDNVTGYVTGPENTGASLSAVNENLKNLTGRQYQQMLRIVNQFQKGKINQAQATLMLKTSLGFTDDEAMTMLGIDTANQVQMSAYNDVDWNSWNIEENYEITTNN